MRVDITFSLQPRVVSGLSLLVAVDITEPHFQILDREVLHDKSPQNDCRAQVMFKWKDLVWAPLSATEETSSCLNRTLFLCSNDFKITRTGAVPLN